MSKYFPATARHAKAQEFLELRQGMMTVMEYMARFTEFARFDDDYVAIDMAKVRRFENGLKLSIRGKIVGLRLQDMNSMVGTALAIERDMDDSQGIRDASVGGKIKEDHPSSSLGLEVKASGKSHCMGKFSSRIYGESWSDMVAISGFDVILDMDELTAHRVVSDCDLRQVIIPDTVLEL